MNFEQINNACKLAYYIGELEGTIDALRLRLAYYEKKEAVKRE